jgi:hypothetical protein
MLTAHSLKSKIAAISGVLDLCLFKLTRMHREGVSRHVVPIQPGLAMTEKGNDKSEHLYYTLIGIRQKSVCSIRV